MKTCMSSVRSINATLEEKGIPHVPHFFVDTSNAPAETIAKTVAQVADEVDAAFIIAAKSNKVSRAQAPSSP